MTADAEKTWNDATVPGGTLKVALLLVVWAAAFIPVYPEMAESWLTHSNNGHGMLVPLLSGFLVWQKREALYGARIEPSNWGLVLFAASIVVYALSFAGAVAVVSRMMIVTSLMGLVLYNFGVYVFRIIAFPLFFLFFMIPIPVSVYVYLSFPLQIFATKVSAFVIWLLGIPVYREGNMLYFAQTQLEVAEACSGLHSMFSYTMLACLFAYLMSPGALRKAVIVASGIPLAIFANIVRVAGTGVLAHFYGGDIARGFLHDFSGFIVFAFGFFLLLGEYVLLEKVVREKR